MKDSKYLVLWVLFVIEAIAALATVFIIEGENGFFLPLVLTGMAAALAFIVVTFTEILKSQTIKTSEKIMWVVCMLFMFNIAGLLYLILRRKTVTVNS